MFKMTLKIYSLHLLLCNLLTELYLQAYITDTDHINSNLVIMEATE